MLVEPRADFLNVEYDRVDAGERFLCRLVMLPIQVVLDHAGSRIRGRFGVSGNRVIIGANVVLHPEQNLQLGVAILMQRIREMSSVSELATVVGDECELLALYELRVFGEEAVGTRDGSNRRNWRPRSGSARKCERGEDQDATRGQAIPGVFESRKIYEGSQRFVRDLRFLRV